MRDAIQQNLVLCSSSLKVGCNESVHHWSAEDLDPLFMGKQLRSSPHNCPGIDRASHPLQSIACLWTRATFVPNLGLPIVQTDVGVEEQGILEQIIHLSHSVRNGKDADVVQIREHLFIAPKVSLDSLERGMLAEGEEEGHQHVPLLASFSLISGVHSPLLILPQISGRLNIEHANKRQCFRPTKDYVWTQDRMHWSHPLR